MNEVGAGLAERVLSAERADTDLRFGDVLRMARAVCPARAHVLVLAGRICVEAALTAEEAQAVGAFARRVVVAGAALVDGLAGVPVMVDGAMAGAMDGAMAGAMAGVLVVLDPVAPVDPQGAVGGLLADVAGFAAERIARGRSAAESGWLRQVRLLRERIMEVATEAVDVAAALSATARILMDITGAASSYVFRLADDGEQVLVLDGAGQGALGTAAYVEALRAADVTARNSILGIAMASGRQARAGDLHDPAVAGQPLVAVGLRFGLRAVIITPLRVADRVFGFSVGFAARPADFETIADLLMEAVAPLRPLLRRLRDEETTALFRRAFDASPDAAVITEAEPVKRPGPRIVYVNRAFTEETGYSAAEAIGQTPRLLQGEGTSDEARWAIRQALEAWRPVRQEILNYRKDGSAFWVELNIAPFADSSGWFTHWVSVQRNMTERREAEAARLEDSREMALLIAAMPGTLHRLRPTGETGPGAARWRIAYRAPSAEALTGYTDEELNAVGPSAAVPEAEREAIYALLDQALREGRATGEFRLFRRRDGEMRVVHARMQANPRADGAPEVIAIWTDVTAEREAAAQAALSGRLATLGEMASGIAHELNQPLTAIVLQTDTLAVMVQAGKADAAEIAARLERIGDQALRAGRIIDNLRDFTRARERENGAVSVMDAVELTRGMVEALMATNGIALDVDLPADLPKVHGEVTRIEQVLVNLLSNARDALLAVTDRARVVRIRGRREGDVVRVVVSDTGAGIEAAHVERLFDPFFTTKGPDRGTGLGLSICRSAMRQMGGEVAVRNGAEGAEFTLTFRVA